MEFHQHDQSRPVAPAHSPVTTPTKHVATSDAPDAATEPVVATDHDTSHYTMTVAEAVIEFANFGCPITDRTVQRYCQAGKLRVIRVEPDTRQLTQRDPYMFLIDPESVKERVAILVEMRETRSQPQPEQPAQISQKQNQEQSDPDEIAELKAQITGLEVDKRVRDQMIKQFQEDRKQWFDEMGHFVDKVSKQSEQIGMLKARLQLSAPAPKPPEEPKSDQDMSTGGIQHFGI